jgi:hypothetical protein
MKRVWPVALLAAGFVFATLSVSTPRPTAHAQGAPTVKIMAPNNGASLTNPATVSVQTTGAVIKAATDNDPNASHLHYFIDRDPASVLRPGEPIPTGQPDIIHTADTSQQLPTLSPGQHRVWVVLAHTDHTPYAPNVQDQVSFTIGAGTQGTAPAQLPTTGETPSRLIDAAIAAACLLLASGLLLMRRPAGKS